MMSSSDQNPTSVFVNHEGHEEKASLVKSFWKSRNLFSKRFLAAGGIN